MVDSSQGVNSKRPQIWTVYTAHLNDENLSKLFTEVKVK